MFIIKVLKILIYVEDIGCRFLNATNWLIKLIYFVMQIRVVVVFATIIVLNSCIKEFRLLILRY